MKRILSLAAARGGTGRHRRSAAQAADPVVELDVLLGYGLDDPLYGGRR